jgi:hypothetical protein
VGFSIVDLTQVQFPIMAEEKNKKEDNNTIDKKNNTAHSI